MRKKKSKLPRGWTHAKIDRLIRNHENQTDEQAIAEIDAAFDKQEATMVVPRELVPIVEILISKFESKRSTSRRR